jgi:hypothetical protein
VISTPTDSIRCISITTHITAYLYVILSVNIIPSFMLSQKALHIILNATELSNGISPGQGILSVDRGRNIRQRICVSLCQVSCCSCGPSFKEEITKLVYLRGWVNSYPHSMFHIYKNKGRDLTTT